MKDLTEYAGQKGNARKKGQGENAGYQEPEATGQHRKVSGKKKQIKALGRERPFQLYNEGQPAKVEGGQGIASFRWGKRERLKAHFKSDSQTVKREQMENNS